MATKPGWQGRVFEDFEVGDVYEHPLGRTVTQADNIWFTLLTVNTNPIHFDSHYAAHTEFGRPLVDSTFTLALVTGLSVSDVSLNAINLGWESVKLQRHDTPAAQAKSRPATVDAPTEPRAVASGSMAVRRDTRSLPLAVLYQNFKLGHCPVSAISCMGLLSELISSRFPAAQTKTELKGPLR